MKTRFIIALLIYPFLIKVYAQTTSDGIKLFRYERFAAAEQTLKQVTDKTPVETEAWYWLIRACLAKDETKKAATFFAAIPVSLQNQPLYKVLRARFALEKPDTVQALANFQSALGNARKKDPAIQLAIAEMNIDADKGDLQYAIDLLTEAIKKDKKKPDLYIAKGDAYRKLYNGSEAFRNYQEAIEIDKTNPATYYKIGKIYQTQNNDAVFAGYYDNAIKADPSFGPVYYQLYYYYYLKDVNKAMGYLQQFIAHSDPDIKNNYLLSDLNFVSKKYTEAITEAQNIISVENNHTKPRIYKLLAYSYDALHDNQKAEDNMKIYFSKEQGSNYAAKDFELMAKIAEQKKQKEDAATWYEKAYQLQTDSAQKVAIVRKMAAYYKLAKQYEKQAYWLGQLYNLKANLTNVDIFNWGVANFNSKKYTMADSVFGIYETRYPEQSFGYYWRARCNAAIDTAMETGIAIPHYENLIKVGLKDTANANTRKWLIQAYGYIAAYKVNKEKLYTDAIVCYDKILELDPGNDDAEKYKGILSKIVDPKPSDNPKNN